MRRGQSHHRVRRGLRPVQGDAGGSDGGLKVGTADTDDFGPVINEEQMTNMLAAVARAKTAGATMLTGGQRLSGGSYGGGIFVAPTIDRGRAAAMTRSRGASCSDRSPCLYRVLEFEEAIALANDSPFGLTASIHTQNINRAMTFLSESSPVSRWSMAAPTAANRICRSAGFASRATAGVKRARRRSTSTRISRRSTSITIQLLSEMNSSVFHVPGSRFVFGVRWVQGFGVRGSGRSTLRRSTLTGTRNRLNGEL